MQACGPARLPTVRSAAHLGAEITYAAQQLGNSPAVVLKFYAKFLPSRTRRWVDQLAAGRRSAMPAEGAGQGSATKTWNHEAKMPALHASDIAQLADSANGEPWWDRTTDPLIKSQVLYQLS